MQLFHAARQAVMHRRKNQSFMHVLCSSAPLLFARYCLQTLFNLCFLVLVLVLFLCYVGMTSFHERFPNTEQACFGNLLQPLQTRSIYKVERCYVVAAGWVFIACCFPVILPADNRDTLVSATLYPRC